MDLFTIIIILIFFILPLLEAIGRKGKERERIEEMRREEEEQVAAGGGEWSPFETEDQWDRPSERDRSFLEEIEERARQREAERAPTRPRPQPKPKARPTPAPRPEPSLDSFSAPDEKELARYRRKLASRTKSLQVEEIQTGEIGGPSASGIAGSLRDVRRVSEAIVLAEVLGPPRSIRALDQESAG